MKTEKIQKVLARAGYGSRRQIEGWIREGLVHVNNRLAVLGDRVGEEDRIFLQGKLCERLTTPAAARVLVYHKAEGEMTTRRDPEGRATVFDHLPPIQGGRWINVGRLDYLTAGLLLFTNDGEFANRLMHPSTQLEREYKARVMGRATPEMLTQLRQGVMLDDGPAHFETLVDGGGEGLNHWYTVTVKQGRNRVVRRLFESQGLKVNRLKRTRFGSIVLPKSLRVGAWLELEPDQVARLLEEAGA